MMAAKMGQTPQTLVMMRLVLAGAITIWENQGSEVSAMLMRDNNRRLFDAMDAIGTANWQGYAGCQDRRCISI